MSSHRVAWWSCITLCAAVAIPTLGCGVDVEATGEPTAAATAAVSGCSEVAAGSGWWNQEFSEQRATFTIELDATPSTAALDAVVGLSGSTAASFTALAAIVRFNADGMIDARDGAGYRAQTPYPYAAGHRYRVEMFVDVAAHRYWAWVHEGGAARTPIAVGYAFRTEQAGVAGLSDLASEIDADTGSLAICNVAIPSGTACVTASAGDGFVSVPLPDATGYEAVTITAQPSGGLDIDAVFGLSAGPAQAFSDIAAAVRFAPSGAIDVRDGDVYRADVVARYGSSAARLRLISDLSTHTYSAFQDVGPTAPTDEIEIARQYRFRTAQAGVTHLDHLNAVIDSDHGAVQVCVSVSVPSDVVYSREGPWSVAPFADDQVVMTDGTTTARVDASGQLIASVAATGRLATDPLGNAYVAAIAGTALTIDQYGPPLAPLWHATVPVAANSRLRAIAGRAGGGVTVAIGVSFDTTTQVLRFTPAGALESSIAVTGTAAATDGELTITTWSDSGSLWFAAYDATGAVQWTRAFAGSAAIAAMAIDPAHRLVFGGELLTSIDFGGGPLRLVATDDGPINGFVAELSSTGAHVFSTRIGASTVAGVATNGPRIAVSGTTRTQFFYKQLVVFDADHPPSIDIGQLSDNGRGGPVAMSPSGRVWWTFEEQFQLFTAVPYLFAFKAEDRAVR